MFWHLFKCHAIPKTWHGAVSLQPHSGWYLHLHVLRSQSLNCHLALQTIISLLAITSGNFKRDVQMYCDELWPWWHSRSSSPLCEVCYLEVGEYNMSRCNKYTPVNRHQNMARRNDDQTVFSSMHCEDTPQQRSHSRFYWCQLWVFHYTVAEILNDWPIKRP